ncbi:MAG: YhdH/YhfP family quinone oxidoreductase [Gammaproteobacteria bacterium]|nr:YhdH/YhfP family quinone oxidoreductase [Gammaproteobacteria bacterium]
MDKFNAFWVEKSEQGVSQSIVERSVDDLPPGDLLIRVRYSSLNYKDALSAKGVPGVTRAYPHTPGIDAAGIVIESSSDDISEGDEIIVTGYDLGMNTAGGFGQLIRVPGSWAVKLPQGMSLEDSMILGTAGLTAGLCVDKLIQMGASPTDGPVLVTGATGGVGSVAVMLLAKLGYEIVALSGKADKEQFLRTLGASSVVGRAALSEENKKSMLATDWAHAIDVVGGNILSNVIKSLKPGGSVAICGLVASPAFDATVLPFILRGINVLGVDSVEIPLQKKVEIWNKFAADWKLEELQSLATESNLEGLSAAINTIFSGQMVGRTIVNLN